MGEVVTLEWLKETFGGKSVFLTGHTGFKGSWLAFTLSEVGAKVTGYALPPAQPRSHFERLGLASSIEHLEGDVRDADRLSQAMQRARPEFVFHLAAQPIVRHSYDFPKETFDVNVGGAVNLLEAVRATSSVRSLVFVTSDKCYENVEWLWGYRENDRLGGKDPYSASKAAAEIVFRSYSESFLQYNEHLGCATVRAGNVIGGGDFAVDRIVPDCIRALTEKRPIAVRNPISTRPWQHVLEPILGYALLAKKLRDDPKPYAGGWNFGPEPENARPVEDLVRTLIERWGAGEIQIDQDRSRKHESGLLSLNCDKAKMQLGWHPRWDFRRTVEETTDWYRKANDGEPARAVTWSQITAYLETKTK